jgi:hypothetical protein
MTCPMAGWHSHHSENFVGTLCFAQGLSATLKEKLLFS